MTTLTGFVVELLTSLVKLAAAFFDVLLTSDPLSAVSLLVGAALIIGPSAVLGYLALGALVDWLGDLIGSPARAPPQQG